MDAGGAGRGDPRGGGQTLRNTVAVLNSDPARPMSPKRTIMRRPNRQLAGMVFTGLLLAGHAGAALTPVTFNFDSATVGDLDGQGGWTSIGFNGDTEGVQVAPGGGGITTVNYAAFDGPGGSSASASNVGAFGTPTGNETFTLRFDFFASSTLGTIVGLGWDNGFGSLDFNDLSTQLGFYVQVDRTGGGRIELFLNGNSLGSASPTFAEDTWRTIGLTFNLAANSGAGTVSVQTKSAFSSSFSPVGSLQNIALTLNRSGNNASDPRLWNTLWTHHDGPGTGLDNIILVPEPGAGALLLTGLAGLGWLRRRHG